MATIAAPPKTLEQTWYVSKWRFGGEEVEHRYGAWPKQAQFHQTRARHLCFGGARGPGKTVTLVEHILAKADRWPGIPILFLRKDLKDLKRTGMVEMRKRWPKQLYDPKFGGQWNLGEGWVRLWNGSIIYFGDLKDWESYKSMTVGMIAIDELNEVEEEAYINLEPTLRWTTGEGVCEFEECAAYGPEFTREHPVHPFYQIVSATNPSPGWVKTRFWQRWKDGDELPGYRFISATAFDNPSLPVDFIPNLMRDHNPVWVRNYIYGDWAAFENMVWERWSRPVHGWRDPIPFGSFTTIEGGIDWGGTTSEAHRTCAYLTGKLPDGRKITFWEYSKQGGASRDFFNTLEAANKRYKVRRWWADASQHRANEAMRLRGVAVHDAPRYKGSVRDGLNVVDRELTPDHTRRPRLYVVEENCPRLCEGIETYRLDPETGEPAKNQADDEVNSWRYNIDGLERGEGRIADGEWKVNSPVGKTAQSDSSKFMQAWKQQKRDRLREIVERMERAG